MGMQSWITYFCYGINFQNLKKTPNKYTLHKQATPDDGLWSIRKRSAQFWEIHLSISTWNLDTYLKTRKDFK